MFFMAATLTQISITRKILPINILTARAGFLAEERIRDFKDFKETSGVLLGALTKGRKVM